MKATLVYEKTLPILKFYCDAMNIDYDCIMKNLSNIANGHIVKNNNIIVSPDETLLNIVDLLYVSKNEILQKTNRTYKANKPSITALKRILKSVPSIDAHKKSWIDDNKQILTDGYRMVILNEINYELPFKTEEDTYNTPNYKKIVETARANNLRNLELPTLAEIKLYIKTLKAEKKKVINNPLAIELVDNCRIGFSAELLRDMLEIFPNAKVFYNEKAPTVSPIYFTSECGEGLLCPVKLEN